MTITFTSKLLSDLLTIINNPLAIQPIVQFILQFIADLIPLLLAFYLGRISIKKKRKRNTLTVSNED